MTLIFDLLTPKVEYFMPLACVKWHQNQLSFSKYCVHKFGNRHTNGRTDKQADNTVPLPASLRNKNHTKRKVYNYYPGDVKSTTTKSFVNKTTIAVGS